MKNPFSKISTSLTRNSFLFLGGVAGVGHETILTHAERPTLLILFAAMIGLPAFLTSSPGQEAAHVVLQGQAPVTPLAPTPSPDPPPPTLRTTYLTLEAIAPDFKILDATESYLRVTNTTRLQIIGKSVFTAIPTDRTDPAANETLEKVRVSLMKVCDSGTRDAMDPVRYDIQALDGTYEIHFWRCVNTPIFYPDGTLQHIICASEDATREYIGKLALNYQPAVVPSIIQRPVIS